MRLPRLKPIIISRYLSGSFIFPFIVGLSFFSFVILLFNLRLAIKAGVEKNIDFGFIIQLLSYSMGWTLGLTIPMSALMATIMSVGSLNADHEIIAMRAGGMTYRQILRPYAVFGLLASLFMIWYQLEVIPVCSRGMQTLTAQIYNYNPTAVIEPSQFNLLVDEDNLRRTIYVESIRENPETGNSRLNNIQVRTSKKIGDIFRMDELIIAEWGKKIEKTKDQNQLPNTGIKALRLYNGYIFSYDSKNSSFRRVDFRNGSMDINIRETNITDFEETNKIDVTSMDYRGLSLGIKKLERKKKKNSQDNQLYRRIRTEYHKRFSLPFSILIFIYLGFPLGITNKRMGKGMGFGQSVIFIFIYFGLFLSSDAIAVYGAGVHPVLAAWMGNIVLLFFALLINLFKTTDLLWNKNLLDKLDRYAPFLKRALD